MTLRTLGLASLAVLFLATPALAGHDRFVVQMKGQISANDGDAVIKTKMNTEDFLTSPDNFLVVYIDALPEGLEFQIEEWEDTNEDGFPDLQVDRDPNVAGTQDIFDQEVMAALEDGRFSVVLLPVDIDWDDDETNDFDGALVIEGKIKGSKDDDQTGFRGKVFGPINDNAGPSAIFKGSIKSVGEEF